MWHKYPTIKKKHSPVEGSSPIYVELYPDAEVNGSLMRHAESQNFLSPRLPHGRSLRWSWRLAVASLVDDHVLWVHLAFALED